MPVQINQLKVSFAKKLKMLLAGMIRKPFFKKGLSLVHISISLSEMSIISLLRRDSP
jgi:hypothetical protein